MKFELLSVRNLLKVNISWSIVDSMENLNLNLLIHIPIILATLYGIWSAQPGTSLFSWHPTCMTIAQFLALEGILFFKSAAPKWRVTIHWALQGSALAVLLIGFIVIYTNKELNERPHFASYHGLAGLITFVYMIAQSVGGVILKYFPVKTKSISKKQLRFFHQISGVLLSILLVTTAFLGTRNKLLQSIAIILPSLIGFSRVFGVKLDEIFSKRTIPMTN